MHPISAKDAPCARDLPSPLPAEALRRCCDPAGLNFDTTDQLSDLPGGLGQARAEEALRFGLAMRQPGYHVFVLGEPGTGRHAIVHRVLRELAERGPTPPDLCYLHNFAEPLRPRLLQLPAGRGAKLRADMQRFIRELAPAVEAALEADPHAERIEALQTAHKAREDAALAELGEACAADGLSLLRTTDGFVFAPKHDGDTMTPEVFEALPAAERSRIEAAVEAWSDRLADLLGEFPGWRAELREAIARAEREALTPALDHLLRELRANNADLPEVLAHLDAVAEDVITRAADGVPGADEEALVDDEDDADVARFHRYQVNLLVDHARTQGAPVVCEDNPGFGNLIGRIEHLPLAGGQLTHFNLIRAGALHRANGGYLVLDAGRLLTQPYAWDGLKRALRSGRIAIEPPAEAQGWSGQVTLSPDAAPCALKVVLVGERELYYLLTDNDPEFAELFKVAADFDDELPRTPDNEARYARLLATLARAAGLRPFDRGAVASLIDEGARHAEHAGRLSLHTRHLADLMREADHFAAARQCQVADAAAVAEALAARRRRASRYPDAVRDDMLEGTMLISTGGERAGQINALVVVELAGERFGHPVRITATARVGEGDVVDIERETELGGAIHSKGVLILSAFLAARYARHQPLSLSASLVFEQSYVPVEGDSASLAELCALLSALAQVPIRQGLAITGSVNQFGEVQAIGGVNEKIEGFFDLCAARGLDGGQGVLIPKASVRHLMLRPDVVEAARAGRFHVWPVATVDEAMSLLTGLPAGVADAKGQLPRGSLNERVARALAEMTEAMHAASEGRPRGRGRASESAGRRHENH